MLRVTTLYASSAVATASYYTRYLTQAPGEVAGVWCGQQADTLGLAGDVTTEALQALLEGRDPTSGTPLGYPLVDRTLANGKVVHAVAGFDATLSAPKSLSLLWALTQDQGWLDAHDAAVRVVLEHLERYGSTTRVRSNGGRLHPDSQGLIAAAFRQTTSRADDPQVHTHLVISAKVQTADGRWLALDARYLKRKQRMLGGLYQSALRNELSLRFGVGWDEIVNGQAEIAGTPEELLVVFSKRTLEIDTALKGKVDDFREREGRAPSRWERAALCREAAVDTRVHKSGHCVADLVTRWQADAAEFGWEPQDVLDRVQAVGREQASQPTPKLTVEQIVEQLSATGSTWSRADVLQAICDMARPAPGLSAQRWAPSLGRACDQVVRSCVDLDPAEPTRRRASDGRSLWIEPVAPHITSEQVLAQEERVLSWAMEAHDDAAAPSTTVVTGVMDVMQADAAAAVAGRDRLVLVIGPAGTGKTTMLRAAVDDLSRAGRPLFGVAPTAKAARVLERETGMPADTVAKLLYEWNRPDRPPGDRYRLPVGATVVVDEAGMLGTGALDHLINIADSQRWRLALVGDPRQLQAVGRGGLFNELCASGRTCQLERIHRFTEPWEAAASLQLRHGDPRALDAYEAHGRIIAGQIEEHLDFIATRWLADYNCGKTTAVTTTTNEHVDLINSAVQTARLEAGDLDPYVSVIIAGGERAHIGDIVATRRNNRRLTTSTGEPVRNRDLWTVTAVGDDGTLTVSHLEGHGSVTLPVEYTAEHVRLGYAATEHGNQSDNFTIGLELATPATTRRGLYVAMTRGHAENIALVVTETNDIAEARDVLEAILASDRADIPAVTQRRELAKQDRPAPTLRARSIRCATPEWFDQLRSQTHASWKQAGIEAAAQAHRRSMFDDQLAEASKMLAAASDAYQPYRDAVKRASNDLEVARADCYRATQDVAHAGFGHKRDARAEMRTAEHRVVEARAAVTEAETRAEPFAGRYSAAVTAQRDAKNTIVTDEILARWSSPAAIAKELRHRLVALDTWKAWADGQSVNDEQLGVAVATFGGTKDDRMNALSQVTLQWARSAGVDFHAGQPTPQVPDRALPELGLC